jgi:hypothetical protein
MAKISNTLSYPGQSPIEGADYLIGTAANSTPIGLQTKTFTIQGIANFIIDTAFNGVSYRLPIFTASSAGQESVLLVNSLFYQDTAAQAGDKVESVLGTTVYLDNGSGVGSLEVAQNVLVKANLTVNNNANILNDFYVAGDSVFDDSVTMNQEIRLIGDVYDSTNTQGNQEQVLVSDGNGKVTWQNFQGSGLEYQSAWDALTNVPNLQIYPLTADNTGKYWVVSVPGTTGLTNASGSLITDWEPGDWAIISEDIAGNVFWDKIDNSSVLTGQGTTGNIAIWTAPRELGDAPIKLGAGATSLIFNTSSQAIGDNSNAFGSASTAQGQVSFAAGNNAAATGNYSVAIGQNVISSGLISTAMGNGSDSTGTASVAIGNRTLSSGAGATALGEDTTASGAASLASNKLTVASGDYSVAFGDSSEALGQHSFAGGKDSIASQQASFAFGENSFAQGQASISIGSGVTAKGNRSIALGKDSIAEQGGSIAIGSSNVAGSAGNAGGVAIGDGNNALGASSVAIGEANNVASTANNAVVMGAASIVSGEFSFAVGKGNTVESTSGTGIGRDNVVKAVATNGIALGYENQVEKEGAVAIGTDNDALGKWSIAFGYKNGSTADYSVGIGQENQATGLNGTAIGKSNTASSAAAVALGLATTASGSASVALNNSTVASGGDSFASGFESTATGAAGTAMGYRTSALGDYAFAAGYLSNTNGASAIAMGDNAKADAANTVAIGADIVVDLKRSVGIGNNLLVKGDTQVVIGNGLEGTSFKETVLGSFNLPPSSPSVNTWVGTDDLFTIGNGQDINTKSNALVLNKNGELKLPSYGGGTITGTATYNLGVDASGNVIEVSTGGGGGGTVTGSGTQDYITKWNSNTAVGNSIMFEGGSGIGLGTVTPSYAFDNHYNLGRYASFGVAFAEVVVANNVINIGDVDGNGAALGLYDDASARTVLVKGGSVRIGTGGAASERLEVEGNIRLSGSGSQDDIYTTNDRLLLSSGGSNGTSFLFDDAAGIITTDINADVGVGVASPKAKLDVAGAIKIADTSASPTANTVGSIRYRVSGNNSYIDMVMQDGATSYAWVNIVQKNW